jgi:glutamate/aspartate transport system substrate-binding protein
MMDDALLAGEMAKAHHPADWVIVGTPQSHEAYGCMLRKNDPQFKKALNASERQSFAVALASLQHREKVDELLLTRP